MNRACWPRRTDGGSTWRLTLRIAADENPARYKNTQKLSNQITLLLHTSMRTIVRFNDDSIQNNTNENIRFCGLIKSFELFGRKINAATDERKKKRKKNWKKDREREYLCAICAKIVNGQIKSKSEIFCYNERATHTNKKNKK